MAHSMKHILLGIALVFILIEFWHSQKENKDLFKAKETKNNLVIGAGAFLGSFISKLAVLGIFGLIYHFRFFSIGQNFGVWLVAILCTDFCYYWHHRTSHKVNWFWASHAVHHSSTDYNLSTAFRLPWTGQLTGNFLFWLWMPLIGFDPLIVMLSYDICLFYQFGLHTETVKKLPGLFEFVFNTPSHHRVHHSSDLKYLDKNHGGILIIWDRLFKTFQAEEEHPNYGLTKKPETTNPVIISFGEWISLYKRIKLTGSFKLTLKYIFQPPGWSHDGSSKTVKQLRETDSGSDGFHLSAGQG